MSVQAASKRPEFYASFFVERGKWLNVFEIQLGGGEEVHEKNSSSLDL